MASLTLQMPFIKVEHASGDRTNPTGDTLNAGKLSRDRKEMEEEMNAAKEVIDILQQQNLGTCTQQPNTIANYPTTNI